MRHELRGHENRHKCTLERVCVCSRGFRSSPLMFVFDPDGVTQLANKTLALLFSSNRLEWGVQEQRLSTISQVCRADAAHKSLTGLTEAPKFCTDSEPQLRHQSVTFM